MIYTYLSHLRYFLFRPACLVCGTQAMSDTNLCEGCSQLLPILPQHCQQCAQFLPLSGEGLICGRCQRHPPAFERTFALFPYVPPLTHWMFALKFYQQLVFSRTFGELLAKNVQGRWYQHLPLPDLILPVPSHPKRLSERGFNQSEEIGKYLARRLKLPLDTSGVIRKHQANTQRVLSASKRKANIKQAFEVIKRYDNQRVVVLDDVVTTGSTVRELAQLLKSNGANKIDIWCCLRRG
jgi:ComF family protein